MFLNIKKPVVRKVTLPVDKNKQQKKTTPLPTERKSGASPALSSQFNGHADGVKSTVKRTTEKPATPPIRRITNKRKASTPVEQRLTSSSGSEADTEDSEGVVRKRTKYSTASSSLEPDLKRQVRDTRVWTEDDNRSWPLIHGADLTSGKDSNNFKSAFEEVETPATIELRSPGTSQPERFDLVVPHENDGYKPLEDVIQTIEHVVQHYLPEEQASALSDDSKGISRRLKRAIHRQSLSDFTAVVSEFNAIIQTALWDGTIPRLLDDVHALPLPLVERILSQVYSRTVSPHVNTLRRYENGTDNVYGELLPRFVHQILLDTHLRSGQIFVDLGSGVGNVVLQAALEVGCESWGIEQMPNPALLADKQAVEFKARCHQWGLLPGSINLLEGDFLASPQIDAVLRRADVILVNNQAFNPPLNDALLMKFLDLKEGAKVVSLKSFVPSGWEIKPRNTEDPRNLLRVVRREYWSGSVSWTDRGGEYFVATKDSARLRAFTRGRG